MTINFVITSDRIIYRSGVFAKRGIEIPLERVNNVIFHQSVIERLLNAGNLLIESGGETGQQRFTDVKEPDRVQALIHSQVDAKQTRRSGGRCCDRTTTSPRNSRSWRACSSAARSRRRSSRFRSASFSAPSP